MSSHSSITCDEDSSGLIQGHQDFAVAAIEGIEKGGMDVFRFVR